MKSVLVYKLTTPMVFTDTMVQDIERRAFTPLAPNEAYRMGFGKTVDGVELANISGNHVLNICIQDKKPEAAESTLRLKLRKAAYELEHNKEVTPNIEKELKDAIYHELLPLTFPKAVKNHTMFFTKCGLLFVEASSANKAEELIAFVRQVCGSLPAVPVQTVNHVDQSLGEFITKPIDDIITLGEKATLITKDEYKMAISKGDIRGSKASELVKDGAFVDSLELNHDGMLKFTVKSDLSLTGLSYAKDLFQGTDASDKAGNFILVMAEVEKMFKNLTKALGGIE